MSAIAQNLPQGGFNIVGLQGFLGTCIRYKKTLALLFGFESYGVYAFVGNIPSLLSQIEKVLNEYPLPSLAVILFFLLAVVERYQLPR